MKRSGKQKPLNKHERTLPAPGPGDLPSFECNSHEAHAGLLETEGRTAEKPWVHLFYELRGQGKDLYTAEGGGEAWLKRERAEFYPESKKKLR